MKHLSTGSEDVPLKENTLRLYSMRFCPYAQRVHLILLAKNIPHDVVYIDLKNKPEWYLDRIASGKVPAITWEGKDLYESLIICDYLEEKYPDRPMYKKNDPLQKALDRILIDRFSRVTSVLYKLFFGATLDLVLLSTVFDELDYFEKELGKRGTPYFFDVISTYISIENLDEGTRYLIESMTKVTSSFGPTIIAVITDLYGTRYKIYLIKRYASIADKEINSYKKGDQPGMVDYMIWPWSERLDMVRVLGGDQFKIPRERFPKMLQWSQGMLEDSAAKQHYCTPEQHVKFLQSRKAGTPDYDNILV